MDEVTTTNNDNMNNDFSHSDNQDIAPLVLLNLGCGDDIREGYTNIDILPLNESVVSCDVRELEYEDGSVDGMLALNVLQCFPMQEIPQILTDWYALLNEGAELVVSVPSLSLAAEEYSFENWSATKFNTFLFGEQTNEGNFHLSAFDVTSLRGCFEQSPFVILSVEEDLSELAIILRAIKPVHEHSSPIKLFIEEAHDDDIDEDDADFRSEWDEEDYDDEDMEQPDDFYDDEIIVDENFEREIEAEIELFKNQINEIEEEFSEIIRNDIEDLDSKDSLPVEEIENIEIEEDEADNEEIEEISNLNDLLSEIEIDEEDDDLLEDVDLIQSINEEIELDEELDLALEDNESIEEEIIEDTDTLPIDFAVNESQNDEPIEEIQEVSTNEEEFELEFSDFEEEEEEDTDENDGFDDEIESVDIDEEFEIDIIDLDEENELLDLGEESELEDKTEPESEEKVENQPMLMSDEEYAKAVNSISIPSSVPDFSLEIPLSNDDELFDDFPEIDEEPIAQIETPSIIETAFSDDSTEEMEAFEDLDLELDQLLEQSIVEDEPKIDFTFPAPSEQSLPVKSVEKQLNIFWEGSQFTYHSLALINREHCFNLLKTGVADVTILPYEEDTFEPEGEKFEALKNVDIRYKQEWETTTSGLPTVLIRHTWPPRTDAPSNSKWIVMQPWEFSELRADFVDVFQRADEVWAPSHFVRNIYVKAGISPDKVQVIPNGVNPQLFTPLGDAYPLDTTKQCKFLFVGGTIYRKGIDVLLQSYVATFSKEDSVTLVIKDLGGDSFYKGQTAQNLIKEIQQNPDAPEIIYIDEKLSEEEMAALYRACTVFVSPYRGEGFSLPTLEAMSSGLPVIVTQGGPTDEFVNEESGWLIPSTHTYIGNRFGNYDLTGNAFVLEPDKEALADAMLRAYAFPFECVQKGLNGSIVARTQLTWNLATMKALKRLDVLYNTTMADEAADVLQDIPDSSTIFAQAEVAFRAKDYDIAIELYNTVYTIRGISAKLALLGVHRLAMIGLIDHEIEFVQDCLIKADEFVQDHPDTLYIKGSLLALQQQWVEASEILNTLIENWDTYRYQSLIGIRLTNLLCAAGNAVYYGSSELEDRTEEVSAAHQLYSASLKDDPNNAEACYGAALCFNEFGLLSDAKKMLEWAIQLSPDFTAASDLLTIIENDLAE